MIGIFYREVLKYFLPQSAQRYREGTQRRKQSWSNGGGNFKLQTSNPKPQTPNLKLQHRFPSPAAGPAWIRPSMPPCHGSCGQAGKKVRSLCQTKTGRKACSRKYGRPVNCKTPAPVCGSGEAGSRERKESRDARYGSPH